MRGPAATQAKTSKVCNTLFAILVSQTIYASCSSINETQPKCDHAAINHPSALRITFHDHACLFISRWKNELLSKGYFGSWENALVAGAVERLKQEAMYELLHQWFILPHRAGKSKCLRWWWTVVDSSNTDPKELDRRLQHEITIANNWYEQNGIVNPRTAIRQ